jgi:hypothetical protein
MHRANEKLYKILVRKSEGKNHLEDLGMGGKYYEKIVWGGMEWMHLAQDRE